MRIAITIISLLLLVGCGNMDQYRGQTDPPPPQTELRYNDIEQRWEFAGPNDQLRYNDLNTRKGDAVGEWSYQPPGARLRYNDLEGEWQWTE
jgi:hypothetical protein